MRIQPSYGLMPPRSKPKIKFPLMSTEASVFGQIRLPLRPALLLASVFAPFLAGCGATSPLPPDKPGIQATIPGTPVATHLKTVRCLSLSESAFCGLLTPIPLKLREEIHVSTFSINAPDLDKPAIVALLWRPNKPLPSDPTERQRVIDKEMTDPLTAEVERQIASGELTWQDFGPDSDRILGFPGLPIRTSGVAILGDNGLPLPPIEGLQEA